MSTGSTSSAEAVCTSASASLDSLYRKVTARLLTSFFLCSEAGFVPGVLPYLSQWFLYERRPRIVALFIIAMPISSLIGNSLSGCSASAYAC
jgi:MFS family permease